ncbi:MAG: hypothetical protein LQ350_005767 [Teloschistes chrysophthalmus]|nr:MAG: hypothetical protein LQ350_005767 [Niorma chrysophthalma]
MSETPSKPPRRQRQKQRNTDLPQGTTSTLTEPSTSRQTKSDLDQPEQETKSTSSPPATNAQTESDHTDQDKVNRRNSNASKAKQIKQTPRKKQDAGQNGASPTPKRNSTPRPNNRPKSVTPVKQQATPYQQYYAGPTFHASPAASSLPMPKWFSKSVPDVNKEPGIQAATQEPNESTSDQSEDSPTPAFVQRVGEQQSREESPLDILFKADREEKQRQQKKQELGSDDRNLLTPKPDLNRPQHHTRHSTGGSFGSLFPMELEDKESTETPSDKGSPQPDQGEPSVDTSKGMYSVEVTETPQQFEQRRAKTLALKKLLLSSIPTTSGSASGTPNDRNVDGTNSGPFVPPQPKRIISAHQASPSPRPSSNLCKEMSASALPEVEPISELPATPTPSRTRTAPTAVPHESSRGSPFGNKAQPNQAHDPPARSFPAPEAALASSPFKKMEDDLRRILKMDNIANDSATSVHS